MAFGTVKRLVAMLADQPISPSVPAIAVSASGAPSQVYRHLFTRSDGHRFLFLWTRSPNLIVDVELDGDGREAIEYRIDGGVNGRVAIAGGRLSRLSLTPGIVRMFEIGTSGSGPSSAT